jgi:hypothetical protein
VGGILEGRSIEVIIEVRIREGIYNREIIEE